ncbi:MAG: Trm112 family protein [Thermoplasmata archaeon]
MKRELMEILRCPHCKGELELKVEEQKKGEIERGELNCGCCSLTYLIRDGIPNMLEGIQR